MADTNPHHGAPAHGHGGPSIPVEGDGINYRGLVWFAVILAATTLFCQVLVWGLFKIWENREAGREVARAPLAAPATNPHIVDGRIETGGSGPQPPMLVSEPANLQVFREHEEKVLHGYDWIDKNAGVVQIPIDRAMDLVLERGLAVRGATAPAAPATGKPATGKGK